MSMRVTLRDHQPELLLKGFESSNDDEVVFAAYEGSVKSVTTMETLRSGYHRHVSKDPMVHTLTD